MRPNQIAHMRMAIVALSMGATLTMAACAQDALAPSYPSQEPPASELPDSPAIIGNEAPDTGPINDE